MIFASFNFGPQSESNKTVGELVNEALSNWKENGVDFTDKDAFHEANSLNLTIDKAYKLLGWGLNGNLKRQFKRLLIGIKIFMRGK